MDRQAVEALLSALDSAPVGTGRFFRSETEKDRYETFLTFALRKEAAARYHFQRVGELLEKDQEFYRKLHRVREDRLTSLDVGSFRVTKSEGGHRRTADEFAHELCAHLAALKAGLDLTATTNVPVIAREKPPGFALDTRRHRACDDGMVGLGVLRGDVTITYEDGREETVESMFEISPAFGYVRIEEFMAEHLRKFDGFLTELVTVLREFRRESVR